MRKCFELRINSWKRDHVSVCEVCGLLHWLQDRKFSIYLNFFHQLMPHVDILYAQLQKRQVCSTFIQTCLQNFVKSINNVREKIPDTFQNTSCTMVRSSSIDEETSLITKEVHEYLSLLDILLLPLFLTVVHSPLLNNAFQPRLWKLLQNHFLFLMKAGFILSSL